MVIHFLIAWTYQHVLRILILIIEIIKYLKISFKKVCFLLDKIKRKFFFVINTGDEVLELGGVPLRGKSALFVENLMNTIQK